MRKRPALEMRKLQAYLGLHSRGGQIRAVTPLRPMIKGTPKAVGHIEGFSCETFNSQRPLNIADGLT